MNLESQLPLFTHIRDFPQRRDYFYFSEFYYNSILGDLVMSEIWKERISLGKKGKRMPEETRIKISSTAKEQFRNGRIHPQKGIKWSKEIIEKRAFPRRGRKVSEETKIKISNSNKEFFKTDKGDIRKKEMGMRAKEYIKNNYDMIKNRLRLSREKQIFPLKDSSIEVKIQNFLKQLGIQFFTHQYMKEIEHGYQCDILIPSMNLVIECDGVYWHKYPIGREIDHIRTKELIEKGFKVLRLWESEINVMDLNKFKWIIEEYGE